MYVIKQVPEDFKVVELTSKNLDEEGKFSYYLLKKKNWNTMGVVKKISLRFSIPMRNIGYGGNKDKQAVTEQYLSLPKKIKKFSLEGVELEYIGQGRGGLSLGYHDGNKFVIVVRNLIRPIKAKINKIVNYFDYQRFSRDNVKIGKYLVNREFKEICELLKLEVRNNDYVGAIKKIDVKLLRLYLHSLQSLLWNQVVEEYVENYSTEIEIPLVSFDAEFENPLVGEIYEKILKVNDIKLKDFLIREIPSLIEETVYRKVFVSVYNFEDLGSEKDELNHGRYKQTFSFELGKGSYGTLVVKQLIK